MTLLAELAMRMPDLRKETTATQALGLLLRRPAASSALAAAVRAGAEALPNPLTFTTEVEDEDGRPDLVARDGLREVLLVEGKFWAGFTKRQSSGAYIARLAKQQAKLASKHAHVGALVYVVPPARVAEVWGKLRSFHELGPERSVGEWTFADDTSGVVVSVVSWQQTLQTVAATGDEQLVADCAQLMALVDGVDQTSFLPWSEEHLTDRDFPRRFFSLLSLVSVVRDQAVQKGVATHTGGRRTTIKRGGLTFGKTLTLGGVPAVLSVAPYQWSRHGQSPVWLRFQSGAPYARTVFGAQCQDTSDGVAVPVRLTPDALEQELIDDVLAWLEVSGTKLAAARGAAGTVVLVDVLPEDDEDD